MKMRLPWSISTTVRNPERLRDFLRVLKQLEGEEFNRENQVKYQILLIKERLYRPRKMPPKYKALFDDFSKEGSYKVARKVNIAREVFEYQKYEDPPMRGRQSVNPLNKLGFSIARERLGAIRITDLGNLFLLPDSDVGYIFFKSLLKLQFPNPWSKDFSEKRGFNIRPFIATLHLIKKTSGLNREEFAFFVPTLIDYQAIDGYAERILKIRKIKSIKEKRSFINKFLVGFYGTKSISKIQVNNLFDYGDNAMRYFRLTRYFRVTKQPLGNWIIDLEPSRAEETKQLLSMYDGSAYKFDTVEDYIDYLSDIKKPELPWEVDYDKSRIIALSLIKIVVADFDKLEMRLKKELKEEYEGLIKVDLSKMTIIEMERFIGKLREFRFKINQISRDRILKGNLERLKELIVILKDKKQIRELEPAEFEHIISETLKILNDEINIKANCIFDDEGNPIGFAPGNKADIEGFYQTFNSIFEATLDVSRHQVYRESIPVMRHLRDFENNNPDKPSYCVFIAPRVHEDTINYFWYSAKFGFEGKKQKIIALELSEYIKILEFFIEVMEKNKPFTHQQLKHLLEIIASDVDAKDSSVKWHEGIAANIRKWEEAIA